jgi:hypothetical protein
MVSPLPVTSSEIGPTIRLANLFSFFGTCPIPRNRATGGESPLNPLAAGFSPRVGRFAPAPSRADAVSPPALPGVWVRGRRRLLARRRRLSPLGRAGPAHPRPRVHLHSGGPESSPAHQAKNPFPFFLFHLFPFSYLYLDILCTKNYPNTF